MDTSIATLAHDATIMLTPVLPYLLKAGDKAAEKAGEKIGEGVWTQAQSLWRKLLPKLSSSPGGLEAAKDLVEMPDDSDAQATMRLQLKKLLSEDAELAQEISNALAQSSEIRATIINASNNSVAAKKIVDSTVIAGNNNSTQS
jgi:hypothetical protein